MKENVFPGGDKSNFTTKFDLLSFHNLIVYF